MRLSVLALAALLVGAGTPLPASVLGEATLLGAGTPLPVSLFGDFSLFGSGWLADLVQTVSGPPGLVIVFVYSFLIAFILPGVSEVVLLADFAFGPWWLSQGVVIFVSGVGKAAGSVLAFHLGQGVKHSGPVERWLRNSRFDVMEYSERGALAVARRYGYAGLALALCVPGFPDTLSVYAFAVLERDYVRFAVATFVGSVGRLLIVLGAFKGALLVI